MGRGGGGGYLVRVLIEYRVYSGKKLCSFTYIYTYVLDSVGKIMGPQCCDVWTLCTYLDTSGLALLNRRYTQPFAACPRTYAAAVLANLISVPYPTYVM